MRRFLGPFILAAMFLFAGEVLAGNILEFGLKDGSVISGELVSYGQGVYTVKSSVLGIIKIPESKVDFMRSGSAPAEQKRREPASAATANRGQVKTVQEPPPAANMDAEADLRAMQGKILGDKAMMSKITAIQNDPEIQEILQDPALMQAINSGDIGALMANPKVVKLLQNPSMQDALRSMPK